MSELLPNPKPDGSRMETGPVQFGDDWPGVFIRGDQALYLAMKLETVLVRYFPSPQSPGEELMYRAPVLMLKELLESCRVQPGGGDEHD